MTTGILTPHPATPHLPRSGSRSTAIVVLLAGYDLMLATLIIVAGSQGVYRFAPPLLLWAMIYALIGLKFVAHPRALLTVLRDNITMLAFPAIAFLSAAWSLEPSHSAYSAIQLTVTYLTGFWIGWRYRPAEIALIVILALSPLIALSLVNWRTGAFGEVYSYVGGLLGIFGNKNTLGRMSLLLALAALALLVGRKSRPLHRAALMGVIAMAALALFLSKSATSEIVMLAAVGLFVALTMPGYRAATRLAIFVGGVLAFLGACAVLAVSDIDPKAEVLALFGKSSSLTGRTLLWDIAYGQIGAHPWFGVGFDAYWDSGTFAAADRIQLIFGEGLISFHNFILDIWVGMGIPGLIASAVTLGTIAVCYVRYYRAGGGVDAAMMLAMFAAAIGVALFNPLLYGQHGNMIIILIALAVSAGIETRNAGTPVAGGRSGDAG